MLRYLIEKEYKQLLRNTFLPKLIFLFPIFMMIMLPWAANMEVKHIKLTVVDSDHSSTSRRLVNAIAASPYFRLNSTTASYDDALLQVEIGTADVILQIPAGVEKQLMRGERPSMLIAANTVNGTKGILGSSYLTAIINDFLQQWRLEESGVTVVAGVADVRINTRPLFNPHLDYKYFIVPAMIVMLLTLLCGFLPALNVVSEKEAGTIEQINVTPVSKFTFILGKLLPYWSMGILVLTICLALAWLFYGIFPVGSLLLVYFFAIVYILGVSGSGLLISSHSATLQQAMFMMFFFLVILLLMSGMFTPIASMPRWAQVITWFNPLRYMMEVMRMIYLKGSGFTDLLTHLWILLGFAAFFIGAAVVSYRKSST